MMSAMRLQWLEVNSCSAKKEDECWWLVAWDSSSCARQTCWFHSWSVPFGSRGNLRFHMVPHHRKGTEAVRR